MDLRHLPHLPAVGTEGAVDLDALPCGGCVYKSLSGMCKRYPPVFMPAQPVQTPQGMGLSASGWAFPPAAMKCGEHKTAGVA